MFRLRRNKQSDTTIFARDKEVILLGHVEEAVRSLIFLLIRLKGAKSEKIRKIHQGISSDGISKRGIDLALWHDRYFRPIFRRLFLYTSNPIATERSHTLLSRRVGTNIPYGH